MSKPTDKKEPGITIPGVEIFRTGIWNGDRYTGQDLDDMVEAFNAVGFEPPVKLGHGAKDSDPAFGAIQNLRRAGDKLIADFANVPAELAEMIRAKRFRSVSAEIFFNLGRNGRKFRRALKAVAVIGADVPGVADLKPLYEATFGEHSFAKLICADDFKPFTAEPVNQTEVEPMTAKEIQEALAKAIADGKAEDITKLTQQLVEASSKEAAEKAAAEAEKSFAEKGSESEKALTQELHSLRTTVATLQEQNAKDREETRQAMLSQKVSKVIPAIRPHVRALYDLASTDEGKVAKFTLNEGDKSVDLTAMEIVDDLVKHLAKTTKMFTTEQGENQRPEAPSEDVGAEVDTKVKAFIAKATESGGKAPLYSEAQAAVLASDPDLKQRYGAAVN